MLRKFLVALAAATTMFALAAAPSGAQDTTTDQFREVFTGTLSALNGSGTTADATVTLVGQQATVEMTVNGATPNAPHAQHVHGTIGGQGSCPAPAADTNGDGIITTPEGVPSYGMIQASLTTTGDTSAGSGLAVDRFPVAGGDGSYTYSRSFEVSEAVADDIGAMHIVVHGIDLDGSGTYDGAPSPLDASLPLEATVPAACGELVLQRIDLPEPYAGASGAEGAVARLYAGLLDRAPEPAGFQYWVNRLQQGDSILDVAASVAFSEEFVQRFGETIASATNEEWVDFIYEELFGRDAEDQGRMFWINALEQGTWSRPGMLVYFVNSPEYQMITGTS